MASTDAVIFTVNGRTHVVTNPSPWLTVNDWLRDQPGLKGTKRMCGEGGCGACVVMVTETKGEALEHRAVNSCLYPVCGLHGAAVTTIEGLGGSNLGKLHPIQERMVQHNASQCGFCTPGMVMNMYSLLESTGNKVSAAEVEHSFDGNICRCTGYRPILDAMKSLSKEEEPVDIEDLKPTGCKGNCPGCPRVAKESSLHLVSFPDGDDGPSVQWYRPTTEKELVSIMAESTRVSVRFVAGDTAKGVYKNLPPASVYIDVTKVAGMSDINLASSGELTIGACVTLSVLIQFLGKNMSSVSYFGELLSLLKHIANTPVRNSATWAGNFMMARRYYFVSDALTAFAALAPTLRILRADGTEASISIEDFLVLNVANVVIQSMTIPAPALNSVYAVHKVMKRHENCHAYANASFHAVVNPDTGVVTEQPRIYYGGVQRTLYRAADVETYLVGKSVLDNSVLAGAANTLLAGLPQTPMATSGSVAYRSHLAENLLYKFFIQAAGKHASPRNISALSPIRTGTSSGTQSFDSVPADYPMTESVQKLEIRAQATGEAVYISDLPILPGQLYGKFVLATEAPAKLDSIDSSVAESMPGVVRFISAEAIPGRNSFTRANEEVFVDSEVQYVGQAIGMVIADSEYNAERAARAVVGKYTSTGKSITSMKDAIAAGSFHTGAPSALVVGNADAAMAASKRRIEGQVSCGSQYHFHMETQSALCVPLEDGMDVFSSTQNIASVQRAVAQSLGIHAGSVNVTVKRLGGGFGGKISRASQIAAATALAAKACNRPVQVHMDIDSNLLMVGKRYPWMMDYEVGFDDDGLIKAVKGTVFADAGYDGSDDTMDGALLWLDNTYNIAAWNVTPKKVKTNTASNTYCRAPGSIPAMFFMESMVEHVAKTLNMSPDLVRTRNFYKKGEKDIAGQPLTYWNVDTLWEELSQSAEVASRQQAIEVFNKENRWKKRAMSRVPTKFGLDYFGAPFSAHVAVYGPDGTVAISHAGIEMGQGINTKAAQVAAATLGIPVSMIHIKAATALNAANTAETGGSISSELVSKATLVACTGLKERIDTSTAHMPSTATWLERVRFCSGSGIDLSNRGWYQGTHTNSNPFAYNCYGVMCTEVELDILTGETNVVRADLLYDCGRSVNPEIDVGQVEGAVVMGLGYWLSEEILYEEQTGSNLTHNTWEYKPPMALDIPQDMRVALLKDSPNPLFALKSKAVGEPPQVMTCSALFAAKHCIEAALEEFHPGGSPYFGLDGPATPDILQVICQPSIQSLTV
ncbi:xanthine dehydrogenase/oxidase-like isoform X2 [Sycon ciliatum]|uniref:xanthine dehydrogenase/oxidase-like isoform X2 n=1 Tax=Sycon ciliatum TaxID=27933 RepID=UPI0031F6E341